jgi:hypothetical protein
MLGKLKDALSNLSLAPAQDNLASLRTTAEN